MSARQTLLLYSHEFLRVYALMSGIFAASKNPFGCQQIGGCQNATSVPWQGLCVFICVIAFLCYSFVLNDKLLFINHLANNTRFVAHSTQGRLMF